MSRSLPKLEVTLRVTNKIDLTRPVLPVNQGLVSGTPVTRKSQGASFQEVFQGKIGKEVQFSKHARERMAARGISLTEQELTKLNQMVEKAAQKGAKESLVLMDNRAFIVSITNKTVVTAVDGQNLKENVFTNIDSAIII